MSDQKKQALVFLVCSTALGFILAILALKILLAIPLWVYIVLGIAGIIIAKGNAPKAPSTTEIVERVQEGAAKVKEYVGGLDA